MKGVHLIILLFFCFFKAYSQQPPGIYFDDINNFWKSYEQNLQCNSDSCVKAIIKNEYLPNSSKCYKELLNEKRFDLSAVYQFWKYPLFLASLKSLIPAAYHKINIVKRIAGIKLLRFIAEK